MFCPKCGSQVADDSSFCMECGASVSIGSAAPSRPVSEQRPRRYSSASVTPERRRERMSTSSVGGNTCQKCGAPAVSCWKEKRIPVYRPSARIEAIVYIVLGVLLFLVGVNALVNGSGTSGGHRGRFSPAAGAFLGPIVAAYGVYRLWKIKNKAYDVTVCTCSSCGDTHIVEAPPKKTTW